MSISGELQQQVAEVLELSAEARNLVEEAAELIDVVVGHLTAVFAASNDPKAAETVRSLTLAREGLSEVSVLAGWVAGELPVFLAQIGRVPDVKAVPGSAVDTSHGPGGKTIAFTARRSGDHQDPVVEGRTFKAWWGSKYRDIADPGTAESVVREAADRLFAGGVRGVAIRIGDGEREQAPLRIYIDTAAGHAAVSWQGAPGIEPGVDPGRPLIVEGDPKVPPVTISAERARVTVGAAVRAAREYVEKGQRPTCLAWNADTTVSRPDEWWREPAPSA